MKKSRKTLYITVLNLILISEVGHSQNVIDCFIQNIKAQPRIIFATAIWLWNK